MTEWMALFSVRICPLTI